MSSSKKILVVCQHFWPEAFRITDICDYMVDHDCKVEVLCGIPNYPSGKFAEGYGYFKKRHQVHNGVTIRRAFEIPRGNNSYLMIFLNYLSFPFFSLFHIPRLLFGKYDKILIYQLSPVMMAITGIIVGKLKRTETTMYVLDLWPENLYSVLKFKNRLVREMIGSVSHWHYRHVDKLVALSEKMKDSLLASTALPASKIAVLPQACEKIYETEIIDAELHRKFDNKFNIIFTGSITPAQSFQTLIDAASNLKKLGYTDINWIIVGDGMARKQVEATVQASGLSSIFFFEGQKAVSEIPRYTELADVLVGCLVKSDLLEATIPAKVMSYIASGKPMVLAMDGEVQRLINDTIQCGYVGPTENAETLSQNILKIYKLSLEERRAMGARGRKYHFAHFERNIVLRQLYEFIFS